MLRQEPSKTRGILSENKSRREYSEGVGKPTRELPCQYWQTMTNSLRKKAGMRANTYETDGSHSALEHGNSVPVQLTPTRPRRLLPKNEKAADIEQLI